MTNLLGEGMPLFGGGPAKRGPASKAELDREQARVNAARDARLARAIELEAAEAARRAAVAKEREAERRAAAEAEVAAVRADVERDLRRGGCPEAEVKRVADEAMTGYHLARATETAERGAKQERELRAFFRNRPQPVFD